jgi:predicted Rossmann-fold nucleotide-binding protein
MDVKQRAIVVCVFGGGSGSLVDEAQQLGLAIATETKWIVFTGGSGPDRHSQAVKHRALVGPGDSGRPWMGLLRTGERLPESDSANGFVFKTRLDHRRNYLEAVLCDAAVAFPGGSGTKSEVVATLCLGKPVVLVGDEWSEAKPGFVGRLSGNTKRSLVDATRKKFNESPKVAAIDELIARDIVAANLVGVEQRCVWISTKRLQEAVDKLAELLDRARKQD